MFYKRWLLLAWLVVGSSSVAATATQWIDFIIVNGLVVIPTETHGIKGHSAIDTGAQFTGIMESFVSEHELKLPRVKSEKIFGVNGSELRNVYRDVPVNILGADLVFKRVVELNISKRGQFLIGGDFLRGLYFQFDYQTGAMFIELPQEPEPSAE